MIFLLKAPSQGKNKKKNWKPKKEALYIYTKCENLQWFLQCGKVYMTFIEDSVIHKVDAIMPSLDWVYCWSPTPIMKTFYQRRIWKGELAFFSNFTSFTNSS